jgi:S1-C subfamily serine protease
LNLRGELIGINTALLTKSGTFEGVGLAIPSNMAASVMRSLREDGRVIRGYLGAAAQDFDEKLARALDVTPGAGALVSDVVTDSPASIAGLRPKDVVVAIDGVPVKSARMFRTMVAENEPGEKLVLEVHRGQRSLLVQPVLIERAARPIPTVKPSRIHLTAGVEGWTLDAEAREMLWVPNTFTAGLVVARVQAGSPAWQAGLRGGDVLVSADERSIETSEELDRVYARADRPVLLRVVRRGTALYLVLEPKHATPAS